MSTKLQEQTPRLSEESLDQIFRTARTSYAWQDKPVSEELLKELFDIVKLGPTSANLGQGRFVFVVTPEAKARLIPTLMPGNVEKTSKAPVTVIVAYDSEFYEKAQVLFPSADIKANFVGNPEAIKASGEQGGHLQAAYLIVAARALGLAAGPMGGFSKDAVNAEFFPDGKWRSLMLINLGYPDYSQQKPRLPRLSFEEAATIL